MTYKELLGYSGLFNLIYGLISYFFGNNPIEPLAIIFGAIINIILFFLIFFVKTEKGVSQNE